MENVPSSDALIDDILTQIHKREMDLQAEHSRLVEIVRTLAPGRIETRRISSEIIAAAPSNGHRASVRTQAPAAASESVAVMGDTRSMSDAARRRLSRRMKAMWRDRKAKGYKTLSRKK